MNFPSTQWSILAQATLNGDMAGQQALAEFHRQYRGPVVAFIRRRGVPLPDAEDLAHGFFVHLMEKSALKRADAARGRFRSFLLGALARHLAHAREQHLAAKRGGGIAPLSLDAAGPGDGEPSVPPTEAQAYDRDWALQLLQRALDAVAGDFQKRGRPGDFEVLRAYLPGALGPAPEYAESAVRLGLGLGAFKTEVHRLRGRLRDALHREVAATVASPEEVDDEVAYLGRVLQSLQA